MKSSLHGKTLIHEYTNQGAIKVPERCVYHGISMVHTHSWIERGRFSFRSHLHPDPDEDVQLRHDLRAPEGLVSQNQTQWVDFKIHQTQWIFMDSWWISGTMDNLKWLMSHGTKLGTQCLTCFSARNGPTSVGSLRLKLGRNFLWHTPFLEKTKKKLDEISGLKNQTILFLLVPFKPM